MVRTASLFLALVVLAGASTTGAQQVAPVVKPADALVWQPRPGGVEVAVLYGDPAEPGPFVLRLRYPAGYRKAPHFHPRDAFVTVLSGSYFRGYGSEVDEARAYSLMSGTFSVNPAGVPHYEWTVGPAELQVLATGPWESVYVDASGKPTSERETGMPK